MMQDHDARPAAPTDTMPAPNRSVRKGFALPMAILVIAFLTITIAAAYSATSAERATNDAQRTESKAYMIAQAGLENFMARRNEPGFCKVCGLPPAVTYESTYVPLKTGIAYVVAQRVRAGDLKKPAIYLLRSRGVDTSSFSIKGGDKKAASQQSQRAER
ncbi:MAG TPA: pilus assembly PilX N-terminal domain-containing protein, partial [Gemmatimonadaceae bacterium]